MTEYYVDTVCSIRFFNVLNGHLPDWHCKDRFVNYVIEPVVQIDTTPVYTIEYYVGVLFVILAGVLGILIASLFTNKIDLFFEPFEKRYRFVQERKYSNNNS